MSKFKDSVKLHLMNGYEVVLSRDSFLLSVELRVFWALAFAYGIAAVIFLFHLVTRSRGLGHAASVLLWAAAFVHIALVIFRAFEAGRGPFQTLYESLSFFAASASVTYLYVSRRWKTVYLPGLFVSAVASGACFYALFSRSPVIEPLSPPLQSWWFGWHVMLASFSYAVFVVSAAVEVSYLLARPVLARGLREAWGLTHSTIEGFHRDSFKLVLFAFPLLTFAIFSGAVWANDTWARYWSWDPREILSLVTWTVFTIYLHSMAIPSLKRLPASVFNIVGFICMMMTFLGVNWLARLLEIPSLHIYLV